MNLGAILQNRVLLTGLIGWILAQALKIPIDCFQSRRWNWALFFAAGGMPSSHSALVTSTAAAVGLHYGFDNPVFGVAVAIAMIVVYDATGIRRQAGMQAQKINVLVDELLQGHPISEENLREVLGHTPLEALGGVLLGLVVALGVWFLWK
ncbi:MAG TPA: divergent PAP2 family protein [Anaerolineales bacterium]|nr:divergent PAP2 family protein [Anaerolineales bacterium]